MDRPDDVAALRAALPDGVHLGTSSWTFPGWQGLVYERPYPSKGGGDRLLGEYARSGLFGTVGIDASYYRPLEEKTLAAYARALPEGFRCLSKVWDRITALVPHGARGTSLNPDFLDAALFREAVLEPTLAHFGAHQGPFVFEFAPMPRTLMLHPDEFAQKLDRFLDALPRVATYAVEVRNREFLTPMYFAVLRAHGVAHVYNHWSRMPPIGEQLALEESVTGDALVARILMPPGGSYEGLREAFAPFDRIQAPDPPMRSALVELIALARSLRLPAWIIVNNKAEGSAPLTILEVMRAWAARGAVVAS